MRDAAVTPIQYAGPRRTRNLEERLIVRFPAAYRAPTALVLRTLNPGSRLRRTLLRRAIVSGWDAATRYDFDLMLVRYAADVEAEFAPEFEALGMGGTFRGHDGVREMARAFDEAWEGRRFVPAFVLDLGTRFLILGKIDLPGTASGIEFENELAQLTTVRDGFVVRDQFFFGWDKGLQAAGLDPDALAPSLRRE